MEELEALIEPCYPSKRRGAGRPAVGLDRMLRIHFLQHWFNLSGPGVEEAIFQKVGEYLKGRGLRVSGGTIVDATLINALSSTKNREKKRDPEMRQTEEGQPVVLWDESSHWSGRDHQADPLGGDHRVQCT